MNDQQIENALLLQSSKTIFELKQTGYVKDNTDDNEFNLTDLTSKLKG